MTHRTFHRTHRAGMGQEGPLTVVFYAGPGTGKSTTTAMVFAALKQRGYNVEVVHEVAKDMVWEKRAVALAHQPYMVAKQMFKMDRLRGQVEAVVTDTSTLYSFLYGTKENGVTDSFKKWVLDDYRRRRTLNVLLMRSPDRGYNPKGRNQTEEEAIQVDQKVRNLLYDFKIDHVQVHMGTDDTYINEIVDEIASRLDWYRKIGVQ